MNSLRWGERSAGSFFKASAHAAVVCGFLAVVGGCASTPTRVAALEEAQARMQALEQDPIAERAASQQLKEARDALRSAQGAIADKESKEKVEHRSYLALRKVQTAEAAVAEAHAREQIARTEAERNRVVLESRERELAARTQEARTAEQAAETAKSAAQQEAEQAQAARAELERLRQELSDLQAKPTDRGMVVTLGDVLFDVNKATLKPGADRTIERLQTFLQEHAGVHVMIEGHTDGTGSSEYNADLSRRRAEAVASALESRGVDRGRVSARGMGEDYPVASNDTVAGRQQNRRVEIVFSDNEGRFNAGAPSASR